MIVIPKNFSKLAMQLDEKTPSKMSIQYKTTVGRGYLLRKLKSSKRCS